MFSLYRTPLGVLFGRATAALPVDLLRVFVGLLSFFYFLHTWQEAADISAPDGLIDHALVLDIYWFTRLGFFYPGISLAALKFIFLVATLASWAVILGWRPKLFAALLFAIAVSTYRWNFLVTYVDDAIMHLMLFWLLLLPVGRTLTLSGWWRDRRGCWTHWMKERVPGTAIGCFLCNLALIYLVAGLWKLTSPMWRDGSALFAVLKLPVSYQPDFWQAEHQPFLKIMTWASLVVEPLIPLALLLRRGHPVKWLLLAGLVGLHGGIVATMKLPFANLACLGGSVVIFQEELMHWLARGARPDSVTAAPMSAGWCGRIAVAFVFVLSLAMLRYVPAGGTVEPDRYGAAELSIDPRGSGGLGAMHKPLYCALWFAGIAQEYQLFNWIDVRNHRLRYQITLQEGVTRRQIDPAEFFPATNRSVLLQLYLHDLCWFKVPADRNAELKRTLALRFAQRYSRAHCEQHGIVTVTTTVERVTAAEPRRIEHGPEVLFSFTLRDGDAVLRQAPVAHFPARLAPAAPPGAPF